MLPIRSSCRFLLSACLLYGEHIRRWSLVRENQQSSAHNFVKDFSLILPKSCRRAPLKEGAVPEISLEYGKTEVQTLFEPLQRFH